MSDEPDNSETNQIVIILKTQNLYHTSLANYSEE
jgi:hypothetical protein